MGGFVGYVRVSTDEQAESGLSLEAQRAALVQYAALYGLQLVEIIDDAGQSAASLDRPGMRRVVELLDHRQVEGVLVAKLDRLTRSVRDAGDLVEAYFARGGLRLISVGEQIDTGSASGRLVLHVLVSVAQWEREAIGERTSAALRTLQARGQHLGNAPYGQRYDAETRSLVGDEAEQKVIAEILALRASGLSTPKIAACLNELGRPARGLRWYQPAVWRILAAQRSRA